MNDITNKLLNDKEFMKKVLPMQPEDALKEFHKAGSDVTLEELNEAGELIKKINANGGELTADMLDEVAGGSFESFLKGWATGGILGSAGLVVTCGVLFGW